MSTPAFRLYAILHTKSTIIFKLCIYGQFFRYAFSPFHRRHTFILIRPTNRLRCYEVLCYIFAQCFQRIIYLLQHMLYIIPRFVFHVGTGFCFFAWSNTLDVIIVSMTMTIKLICPKSQLLPWSKVYSNREQPCTPSLASLSRLICKDRVP